MMRERDQVVVQTDAGYAAAEGVSGGGAWRRRRVGWRAYR